MCFLASLNVLFVVVFVTCVVSLLYLMFVRASEEPRLQKKRSLSVTAASNRTVMSLLCHRARANWSMLTHAHRSTGALALVLLCLF